MVSLQASANLFFQDVGLHRAAVRATLIIDQQPPVTAGWGGDLSYLHTVPIITHAVLIPYHAVSGVPGLCLHSRGRLGAWLPWVQLADTRPTALMLTSPFQMYVSGSPEPPCPLPCAPFKTPVTSVRVRVELREVRLALGACLSLNEGGSAGFSFPRSHVAPSHHSPQTPATRSV